MVLYILDTSTTHTSTSATTKTIICYPDSQSPVHDLIRVSPDVTRESWIIYLRKSPLGDVFGCKIMEISNRTHYDDSKKHVSIEICRKYY